MPLSGTPPPTSAALQNMYEDIVQPLFFPPPVDFTQLLLDSFVECHDQLLEDNTVFTVPSRVMEIGVELDGVAREFRRHDATESDQAGRLSVGAVRKLRLRSRLQHQADPRDDNRPSREEILVKSKQRMEKLDVEMKQLEEKALEDFKEGLRRAVS